MNTKEKIIDIDKFLYKEEPLIKEGINMFMGNKLEIYSDEYHSKQPFFEELKRHVKSYSPKKINSLAFMSLWAVKMQEKINQGEPINKQMMEETASDLFQQNCFKRLATDTMEFYSITITLSDIWKYRKDVNNIFFLHAIQSLPDSTGYEDY